MNVVIELLCRIIDVIIDAVVNVCFKVKYIQLCMIKLCMLYVIVYAICHSILPCTTIV